MGDTLCVLMLLLAWIGVNIADGFWVYYYVVTSIDPDPRTAVDRTNSGFIAFYVMMWIFGFIWGCVNLMVWWGYYKAVHDEPSSRGLGGLRIFIGLFSTFIALPLALFMIIMPFFGAWIVTPLAASHFWNHACDGYPMYAILDARSYNQPDYVPNVARFYLASSTSSIFTYDIGSPDGADFWFFHLREFDTDQSSIPLDNYPTLQSVEYDFINSAVSGNCTVPSGTSEDNTTTTACLHGSFSTSGFFFFNITSSVPLNTSSPSSTSPESTLLRSQDKNWIFNNGAPALTLRTLDSSGDLGQTILRTATTAYKDCTQLKVCLAGLDGSPAGAVGAEVLAPLGIILMNQDNSAIQCTTPSDDSD
ncbi:hypothetical protein CERSUDRAFT_111071 [Gelatoporia subvermispora B]|uniref:Uncharacterized protein n=1 Tax=Ceriporiopsis subvermispora (strain B) TaxID=914234 RepID=M2RPW3_CERS8|nr:hypothetical protein CERSUDRAFT_111071 [Gelatoporia subvermispora B]